MPHSDRCPRNDRPTMWQRMRYGKLATLAMRVERPCLACERDGLTFDLIRSRR